MTDGGYDDGYSRTPCLWGSAPGSLVADFLRAGPSVVDAVVWDLGCGEGKNASAFSALGADVRAVDCSQFAVSNGQAAWPELPIKWSVGDAAEMISAEPSASADYVIMYGLTHCLPDMAAVSSLIEHAKRVTRPKGQHFLVAFNDGPHDLSAHPGFSPLLLSHEFYKACYADWEIRHSSSSILNETHPHNNIPHFHSVTRMWVRRP